MKFFGQVVDVVKNPVNTVPDRQVILERLHMDVTGPLLDSLVKHRIDEVYDRCFIRRIEKVLGFLQVRDTDGQVAIFEVFNNIPCRIRCPLVCAVDSFQYGPACTEDRLDLLREQGAHIFHDLIIDGTGSYIESPVIGIPEGENSMFSGELDGEGPG